MNGSVPREITPTPEKLLSFSETTSEKPTDFDSKLRRIVTKLINTRESAATDLNSLRTATPENAREICWDIIDRMVEVKVSGRTRDITHKLIPQHNTLLDSLYNLFIQEKQKETIENNCGILNEALLFHEHLVPDLIFLGEEADKTSEAFKKVRLDDVRYWY